MQGLTQAESGCLLLADISGYTAYLQATELEHAQDVLADLLETLVSTLDPVFKLAKLEGDAAFAYAPSSGINPTMIMDTVEAGYFAFRRRLRDIEHATSCECNACVLIPSLDLKYFIHDGEYVARRIAGTEELTGPDVVLVHRLMKGTAGDAINKPAYAAYTKTTFEHFGVNPEVMGFTHHVESFDDIGEVEIYIQDMSSRWAFEQERNREYVTEDDAVHSEQVDIAVEPAVLWEYITDPAKKVKWQHGVTDFKTVTPGRMGAGSVNHCMHGPDQIIEHVADWRPFSYVTLDYPNPSFEDGHAFRTMFEFQPIEHGTRLVLRIGSMTPDVAAWWAEISEGWLEESHKNGESLATLLQTDLGIAAPA